MSLVQNTKPKKTKNANIEIRNQAIKAKYEKLAGEKRYRSDYIIAQLAVQFFLSERTIINIIYEK